MKKSAKKATKKATKKVVKKATKKTATKKTGRAAASGAPLTPLRAREPDELRVASWNVNGIRSVFGKGLREWIAASDLDVVMLQEVKATSDVMATDLEKSRPSCARSTLRGKH